MSWFSRLFASGRKAPSRDGHPDIVGPLIFGGYRRATPRRGTQDLLASYARSPVLQSIARKVAYAVASARYYVEVDGEEVPGHMLAELFTRGPDGLSGVQAALTEELHLLLVGEAFAALDLNMAGFPVQRWPLPPHWVIETPTGPNGNFHVHPTHGSGVYNLPRSRMVWFKEVDPLNPYERGAGTGRSLSDELETDERAAQHLASTLANRALPETIVSGTKEAQLDQPIREKLQAMLEERFGGLRNRGRTLVSSGPLNIHSLTPSFAELRLTELRADERDIMIQSFGIPPELIGKLNASNRATIESAEYIFARYVVEPRLAARCSTINDQVSPLFGEGVKLCFESPVPEDREHKLNVVQRAPHAFSIDEVREMAGLRPLEDGRGERFPQAMATRYADYPATVQPETRAKDVMRKADEGDVEAAVNALSDTAFSEDLEAALNAVIAEFGDDAIEALNIGISFNLFDDRIREFIAASAAERSRLITGTSRERLRATLAEGVAAGESTQKLVARIKEVIGTDDTARARMISRTEIVRASNFGTTEAHRQAGIEQRQWLATADSNVRDTHSALDGQTVGIDEPFEISGAEGMYPGGFGVASLDINCRCHTLPVFPEELTREQRAGMWKVLDNKREPHERELERRVRIVLANEASAAEDAIRRRA